MAQIHTCLLDGDILRYEIGSIQQPHPFLPGEGIAAPEEFIRKRVDERVRGIVAATGATHLRVFLTGPGNFRFDIATQVPYKGNRDGFEKPIRYSTVTEHLKTQYNAETVTGIEADDILAIEQFKSLKLDKEFSTCIASRDKDLRMTPGYHYSWSCGERQNEKPLYWVTPTQGKHFFYKQLLTGDATDNIIGCGVRVETVYKSGKKKGQPYTARKGVGPKTAEKYLCGPRTEKGLFEVVKREYKKIFEDNWYEVMLENARLLYIGQTPETLYNFPEEFLDGSSEYESTPSSTDIDTRGVQSSADES